jgi:hypothetical protein
MTLIIAQTFFVIYSVSPKYVYKFWMLITDIYIETEL